MNHRILLPAMLMGALLAPALAQQTPARKVAGTNRTIDLVICLDTSGSMDGLIDAARRKIWTIVNDLALAKPTPRLRVALLSYGNNGHPEQKGWVKVESDLTQDLDLISSRLFALTTNGGTELVGRVIQTSLDRLAWQPGNGLKLIVVAGNESADQDKAVNFRDACKHAITAGVMVDSIYCAYGSDGPEVAEGWKQVALLADGHYATIDQNRGTITIATPFDTRMAELSKAINGTYVPWGKSGRDGRARQVAADAAAKKLSAPTAAARAQTKAGGFYHNSWCLADAVRDKLVKLEEVKQEDLPENLRGKSIDELRRYLEVKLAKRGEIQKEIQTLNKQRQVFIAAAMKKRSLRDDKSFDAAVRRAIREQAARKGYRFESE